MVEKNFRVTTSVRLPRAIGLALNQDPPSGTAENGCHLARRLVKNGQTHEK